MIGALKQIPWLPSLLDLVRLAIFAAFVALGLRAARRVTDRVQHRRRVRDFIVYFLGVTCAVGLVQQESWPFTTWALVHTVSKEQVLQWRLEAIDAGGRVWPVDPRIVEPMPPEDFDGWLGYHFPGLDHAQQQRVLRFLLDRAEQSRRRIAAGGAIHTNGRILGPLAAPYHFQRAPVWNGTRDVGTEPFAGIRIVEVGWNIWERANDDRRVTRRTVAELDRAR
jgi:hypothetical protein